MELVDGGYNSMGIVGDVDNKSIYIIMIQKNISLTLLTQHVNSLNTFCTCFAQL